MHAHWRVGGVEEFLPQQNFFGAWPFCDRDGSFFLVGASGIFIDREVECVVNVEVAIIRRDLDRSWVRADSK